MSPKAAILSKEKVRLFPRFPLSKLKTQGLITFLLKQGNEAFKAGEYELAIANYSDAIEIDPGEFTYVLNRCMCLIKLGR